jgi:hypothetical protein
MMKAGKSRKSGNEVIDLCNSDDDDYTYADVARRLTSQTSIVVHTESLDSLIFYPPRPFKKRC